MEAELPFVSHLLGNLQSKDIATNTHTKKWYKLQTMSFQLLQQNNLIKHYFMSGEPYFKFRIVNVHAVCISLSRISTAQENI
jgi:hypothetical protein